MWGGMEWDLSWLPGDRLSASMRVGDRVRHKHVWRLIPFTITKISAVNPITIDAKSPDGKIQISSDIKDFDLWDTLDLGSSPSSEKTVPLYCVPHQEGSTPIRLAEKNLECWFVCKKCGEALRKFDEDEEQDLFDFSVKF